MFFFFNDTATTEIYTLSLHDALPIFPDDTKTDNQNQQFAFRGGLGAFGRGGLGGPFGGGNNAQTATSSDQMKKKQRVLSVPDQRTASIVVSAASELMPQIAEMIANSMPIRPKSRRSSSIHWKTP